MYYRITALSLAWALSACTIVQVEGGAPASTFHFGILKIEPAAGARSLSYRVRGIGIVPVTNGATIGAAREDAVLAYHPEDCRVVVFGLPDIAADRADLLDRLTDPALCRPRRTQ